MAKSGHDVRFLCQTHYGRTIQKVRRLCLKGELGDEELKKQAKGQFQTGQVMSEQYLRGMLKIKQEHWHPDVVISHSGWGCGLHVKELWPNCRHISYLEWWFNPQSDLLTFDPDNSQLGLGPKSVHKLWKRNQALALELVCADKIVAPSKWQKSQLPISLQKQCAVIFDGVDIQIFQPNQNFVSNVPLITYGTRGMEPIRCFPEFINELPYILKQWKDIKVEIAGNDEINYCGQKPDEGSWGKWAIQKLEPWIKSGRVKFVGRLNQEKYVQWLQSSWCHVYLTQPFVCSWSLLESLACGCHLIASDLEVVREFRNYGEFSLVDTRKSGFLRGPVQTLLSKGQPTAAQLVGRAQRLEPISRTTALKDWLDVAGVNLAATG